MADPFPPLPDGSDGEGTVLFGRYRVLRTLGRGGMGIVLLAEDAELGIRVAVKLVPDMLLQDVEAIAGLKREVLRGMDLTHPGIVRTHHFARDSSGAGIVMEFVEGQTLTELKGRQPGGCFDSTQLMPWLEQLCPILDYAHGEARIVHRDLKPGNLMITRTGRVKIADFGISATLSDSMSRRTGERVASGTPSYMSPQQAMGKKPHPLDDIYSLGATIYELLTGKPPFFQGHVLGQVLHEVPPPMAERRAELEIVGKGRIPAVWEETIAACLSKERTGRPSDARDVLARLRGIGDAPTLKATVPQRLDRRSARWVWPAAVAAVSLTAWGLFESGWLKPGKPARTGPQQIPEETPALATTTPTPLPKPEPTKVDPASEEPAESRFEVLMKQGRALADEGNTQAALSRFKEANALDPSSAETISEMAGSYETLGLTDQAAEQWKRIVNLGSAAGPIYVAAEARLKAIQTQTTSPTSGTSSRADAVLGIGAISREERSDPSAPSRFAVEIPLKAKPGSRVDVRDVDIHVLFYDQVAADKVVQTDADVSYKFTSAPINWENGEPETLEVQYSEPSPLVTGGARRERKFFGYVVRVYYMDELQDTRADPTSLTTRFPAPSRLVKIGDRAENSLGMKFVRVPITGGRTQGQQVLFSIWETRVQDFDAFTRTYPTNAVASRRLENSPALVCASCSFPSAARFAMEARPPPRMQPRRRRGGRPRQH